MPVVPTYPGVYIEEIPSGVRTIAGIPTATTAFVGRAKRGPLDSQPGASPVTINSFAEYENIFGGLWPESPMSYAVRDFFLNGGGQAVIVRIFSPSEEGATDAAEISLSGDLILVAANPGSWGNQLRVRVDRNFKAPPPAKDRFNLSIQDGTTGAVEVFRNLTVKKGDPQSIDTYLEHHSALMRVKGELADGLDEAPETDADLGAASSPFDTEHSRGVEAAGQGSDGTEIAETDLPGSQGGKTGIYALERVDLFNLLCIPPLAPNTDVTTAIWTAAAAYCELRRAFLIVDAPKDWTDKAKAKSGIDGLGISHKNAAVFFPRLLVPNPKANNQVEPFAPCGAVAGVMARTDAQRGIWKAPAGLDATLMGVPQLSVPLTDAENGELNPLGINCLRSKPPAGRVVWGSRTTLGDDRAASEWKYIPVRRLALMIEESLYRGTQWVVFEPNDEPLWAQIRLNVGAFMHNLFRQGAFQGSKPSDAYLVKCDHDTTTQNHINQGIVNIVVGFAPLKPAEFVILRIQQLAGQIAA